ncbi:hypothetical protein [Kitasatospora purpeofusca]|uniref:hypothetical protein n=1 Tax=Kitasatospora purpeofusca TaxID=67352 RepID=UPI002A59E94D|nr:hypothetical protein [Kitasatospora purpeofusca]MDY0815986.1 hypothetical protein [Kitasatospora purpeofusca]
MNNLEELLTRVHNPEVRPLIRDGHRAYASGIPRAAIVLTWTAVCADLIAKARVLAEDGEPEAQALAKEVERAQGLAADTDGNRRGTAIPIMLKVERTILDTALKLELIDSSQHVQLARLQEDRHQSAHPSLRPLGELYEPSAEYARAHLLAALDAVLIHPPSQGRKVRESFAAHVADSGFLLNAGHLTNTYFDRVRPAARSAVVDFAAKHAVLQIEEPTVALPADVLADRLADCLRCFADRDVTVVEQAMAKQMGKLAVAEPGVQLSALARLGDLPAFWRSVPESLRGLFEDRVVQIGTKDRTLVGSLTANEIKVLGLVTYDDIRKTLPGLEVAFAKLHFRTKVDVIRLRPDPYYASYLPEIIGQVGSYDSGNSVMRNAVAPCAPFLDTKSLAVVLRAWWDNNQCWGRRVNDALEEVYQATAHLGADRDTVWKPFVEELGQYPDLYEDVLRRFGWTGPVQTISGQE